MMQRTNHPHSVLGLLDLPLELFQRIIYEAILARGITRGVRLRLVSRLFSKQVHHVLFLYNMLDARLSLHLKQPPFTSAYIEHRVHKEPKNGNPALLCIRQVAEHLTSDEQATRHYITSLCTLAARRAQNIFLPNQAPWNPVSQADLDEHIKAAAVYMNHLSEVELWEKPNAGSSLFGSCFNLATEFGSRDMIEIYLRGAYVDNRCRALWRAAYYHQTDMVRFVFTHPQSVDRITRTPKEIQALERALRTPNPTTWDYVMGLHQEYGLSIEPKTHKWHLEFCARRGWIDMARRLLEYGIDPNVPAPTHVKNPIFYAAEEGHTNVVKLLLDWGARIENGAVTQAASKGHLETVDLLLDHDTDITGAVVAAAKGGYGDVVKLLLESGGNANEDDGELPAIGYAILTEHTRMFYCLIKYGAHVPAFAMREKCVRRAKGEGVESMLALLELNKSRVST